MSKSYCKLDCVHNSDFWSQNFFRRTVHCFFPGQWMSLIRHAFGETLRVNSGEPNGGEFILFLSENFFILGREWISRVMLKVKHFFRITSGGAGKFSFVNIIHCFVSLQIFSRHKINDCIIFVTSPPHWSQQTALVLAPCSIPSLAAYSERKFSQRTGLSYGTYYIFTDWRGFRLTNSTYIQEVHGRLARWRKWRSCDVGEAKEGLENELWRRWSNGRVGKWDVS